MRGSIVKRESGRYAVVVDLPRDPVTGKRRQKWTSGFKTERDAERHLADVVGKAHRGELIVESKTPLADYLTTWLDGRAGELAALSVTQYRGVIRNHVAKEPIGSMPLRDIRRVHVKQLEQRLQAKGLAAATRGVVMAVVGRALADAVDDELLSSNPAAGVRRKTDTGKRGPKSFTVWTAKELQALLATTADASPRLAGLWRLAVATGARRGELLGFRWQDIDAAAKTISVAQQVVPTRGGATIAACKTKGSHRTIRLDDETLATLERHRLAQQVERSLAGDAYTDHDLVFCNELGQPLHPQKITDAFGKHRAAAGIRPGRLHDVRHTVASTLLTKGVPVHIVAARLGHSSPVVTMSVYAHILPKSDERAADVMAEVLAASAC